MKRAGRSLLFACLPLLAAWCCPISAAFAWSGSPPNCSGDSNCQQSCCFCRCCHDLCNYHPVDDCTHWQWERTWWGPYALETPLRQYYVPRSPSCCGVDGYSWKGGRYASPEQLYRPSCMSCENSECSHVVVAATPMDGFYPSQFERLGKIRNELDLAGGTLSSPGRLPAAGR